MFGNARSLKKGTRTGGCGTRGFADVVALRDGRVPSSHYSAANPRRSSTSAKRNLFDLANRHGILPPPPPPGLPGRLGEPGRSHHLPRVSSGDLSPLSILMNTCKDLASTRVLARAWAESGRDPDMAIEIVPAEMKARERKEAPPPPPPVGPTPRPPSRKKDDEGGPGGARKQVQKRARFS